MDVINDEKSGILAENLTEELECGVCLEEQLTLQWLPCCHHLYCLKCLG